MNWAPVMYVGQLPPGAQQGAQQGIAAADAYTYGAASQALSEGQALAAWAALSEQQNFPAVQHVLQDGKLGCPPGWLISPDGGTCVNIRNTHIALLPVSGPSADDYWRVAELTRWYVLNAPGAFKSFGEAKDALPQALRELGYLQGAGTSQAYAGGWPNVVSQVHALTRALNQYAGTDFDKDRDYKDLTEKETEDALIAVAAPVYDAAIARGGDVPAWVFPRAPILAPKPSVFLYGLAVGAALGLAWLFVPGVKSAALPLLSKARALLPKAIRP